MAWRRPGDEPLSEPMIVVLSTQICITRPQWVHGISVKLPLKLGHTQMTTCHTSKWIYWLTHELNKKLDRVISVSKKQVPQFYLSQIMIEIGHIKLHLTYMHKLEYFKWVKWTAQHSVLHSIGSGWRHRINEQGPGPWFNIKMSSYQYRKSHCGDKTVVRSSYLHNGISYTDKMSSLYWIGPLDPTSLINRFALNIA